MNKKLKKKRSGFGIVVIFLLVIVGASTLLTGGIFPKLTNSVPPNQGQANIPITPNPEESNRGSDNLQIKTFGFKTSSPSPIPQNCAQTLAVDFLIDSSGSMSFGNKMSQLQEGLKSFTNQYPDTGLIAMQKFNDPHILPPTGATELVPFSAYKDVKSQVQASINKLVPGGSTYSKNAFEFTKPKLIAARSAYPAYKIVLIFISDGVPETFSPPPGPGRFNPAQDPTTVAQEIKNSGIRIFTLAYLDQKDKIDNNKLTELMTNVASSPSDFYIAPSSNQVATILTQIATKLCQ